MLIQSRLLLPWEMRIYPLQTTTPLGSGISLLSHVFAIINAIMINDGLKYRTGGVRGYEDSIDSNQYRYRVLLCPSPSLSHLCEMGNFRSEIGQPCRSFPPRSGNKFLNQKFSFPPLLTPTPFSYAPACLLALFLGSSRNLRFIQISQATRSLRE